MSKHLRNNRPYRQGCKRKGAAVVEFALLLPVLLVITFGAIDAGQFVNVSQIVNTASRESARLASRSDTTNVETVTAAVESYIAEAFPVQTVATLTSAVTVEVGDSNGAAISGADLSGIDSGTPITVRVVLQYDAVRWLRYLPGFNAMSIETTTTMRRE